MVEENVIAEDRCTDVQLKLIARRTKRGLPLNQAFPLGKPSSDQDECWYLRSEAKSNSFAFDMEVISWSMLEPDAILDDRCTEDQLSLITRREQRAKYGLPSSAQIEQRRIDLGKALGFKYSTSDSDSDSAT